MFIPILPIVEGSKPIQNKAKMIGALHYFETIYSQGHVPYKDDNGAVQPIFDNMMRESSKLFYRQMGCNPDAVVSAVHVNKNSGWQLYPNLAETGTTLHLVNAKNNSSNSNILILTDLSGREISTQKISTPYYSITTDGLSKGIYFVQVRNNDGELQLSDKIVLQ
jgi:hypothetical protein